MMAKLRLEVDLEYDAEMMHGDDEDSVQWFMSKVILGNNLILYDNDMGDSVGTVSVLKVEKMENPA